MVICCSGASLGRAVMINSTLAVAFAIRNDAAIDSYLSKRSRGCMRRAAPARRPTMPGGTRLISPSVTIRVEISPVSFRA